MADGPTAADPGTIAGTTTGALTTGTTTVTTRPPPGGLPQVSGFAQALGSLGLSLTNLDESQGVEAAVPGGVVFDTYRFSHHAAECAYFINVPVAKCHNLSCTTLCTKNIQGTVLSPQRHLCSIQEGDEPLAGDLDQLTETGLSLHEDRFCHKHADLVSARQRLGAPRLCVIDGLVGRDGTGFRHGDNRPMGWTLIGENEIRVDAVGTYLMGLDPEAVPYLKVAAARGLGTHRIDEIEVVDLATGQELDREALGKHRMDPPLMPLARYQDGYYARFRPDGSVVPWNIDCVNEQLIAEGKEPVLFDGITGDMTEGF
ncbi:DUF362 domain-containing protein [Candidatus Latescibacterota bacterium]